tara:strand:- start:105 stop:662 length:558 start_codon:yes stop_codon:yes gene_type:complete
MNHTQRQLIKEAYQEGYYQALEENLGRRLGAYIGKKLGGFLKKVIGHPEGKIVDVGGTKISQAELDRNIQAINQAIGHPGINANKVVANTDQFRGTADDLYNKALKAVRTNLDDQITGTNPLPDVAQDFLDEMGDLIDDLTKKVQDGELTQIQAILKLMNRYPAFFNDFGTSMGSRFDDLPGLDP